jgi:uncharacterized membrane protein YheB (UPF0754 family)
MEPSIALILSIILGSAMTVESFRKLSQTHQSRQQLIESLQQEESKLLTLKSLSTSHPTKDDLEKASSLIRESLEKLDTSYYRKRIREGLDQDSSQGQKNYIISLVRESLSLSKDARHRKAEYF